MPQADQERGPAQRSRDRRRTGQPQRRGHPHQLAAGGDVEIDARAQLVGEAAGAVRAGLGERLDEVDDLLGLEARDQEVGGAGHVGGGVELGREALERLLVHAIGIGEPGGRGLVAELGEQAEGGQLDVVARRPGRDLEQGAAHAIAGDLRQDAQERDGPGAAIELGAGGELASAQRHRGRAQGAGLVEQHPLLGARARTVEAGAQAV